MKKKHERNVNLKYQPFGAKYGGSCAADSS